MAIAERTEPIQLPAGPQGPLPSPDELIAHGKALRGSCPRAGHAGWSSPADRRDPLALIEESNQGRIPELLPIRYGRMLQSPFTFFRGAAAIMAADLARTPTTGARVQACGDCHLLNFGGFATPERRLLFDINDFDETLPAPWEWDVKRLAASFAIASRHNGFRAADARDTVEACARSYRKRLAEFSDQRVLQVWYASIDADAVLASLKEAKARKRLEKRIAKAASRDVFADDFPKLADLRDGRPVIKDNPPLIYHRHDRGDTEFTATVVRVLADYRETLPDDRHALLERYRVHDVATKVVGVGSVGTMCAIALLMAGETDPLFLQVKEARRSVLEPFAGESAYRNRGQRIVAGQRLMQAASDLFLGWTAGPEGRHFYVRQLRDMKLKPLVEHFTPTTMRDYAKLCGWALARAHARSGQPAVISGYLGKSDRCDRAVTAFAMDYADQNERDYEALQRAVREGRIEAARESHDEE
jgi:uncharacterized protein (DUF2252 family)